MHQALELIIEIQELDIKMIRLMRLKRQRQSELKQVSDLLADLKEQLEIKEKEIADLEKQIALSEEKIQTLSEKQKKLETKQASVKKVEEFNALSQEMNTIEREKDGVEKQTSNILDKKATEEEIRDKLKESLDLSIVNTKELENEIHLGIDKINEEGQQLKEQREEIAKRADPDILKIYERLLRNKKDRVVVPIENRTCSGCHIALTLQHENLVRKGKLLPFCEHCSRVHFWQESESVEGAATGTRRRRRRVAKT